MEDREIDFHSFDLLLFFVSDLLNVYMIPSDSLVCIDMVSSKSHLRHSWAEKCKTGQQYNGPQVAEYFDVSPTSISIHIRNTFILKIQVTPNI